MPSPNLNAALFKRELFAGKPYCTIYRSPQPRAGPSFLSPAERKKLEDLADFVMLSFTQPTATGGFVVAIGIRGHSGPDPLKHGQARLDFEQKVSEQRAEEVADILMDAIRVRIGRLGVRTIPTGDPFDPIIEGVGAAMPVRGATTAALADSNGRVEIFLLRDSSIHTAAASFDLPPQKQFDI